MAYPSFMLTKNREALEHSAEAYLAEAHQRFEPAHTFACFSGGNDSLGMTHFVMERVDGAKVVHINTGIGVKETREFVRDTCRDYGWPLLEYAAPAGSERDSYRDLCLRYGFPGPAGHRHMYKMLKERQIRRLLRDHGGKRDVLLTSGIRQQESSRRMRTTEAVQDDVGQQWCNPFYDWTSADVSAYRVHHELPVNEVTRWLHMSGECLCGAYAKPGELRLLEMAYPETANEIKALEEEVHAAGFPWGWNDERPPEWWQNARAAKAAGQYDAFADELERDGGFQPLCMRCNAEAG